MAAILLILIVVGLLYGFLIILKKIPTSYLNGMEKDFDNNFRKEKEIDKKKLKKGEEIAEKKFLEKYIKNKNDLPFWITAFIILTPGTLIIITWLTEFMGIYQIGRITNTILIGTDYFIIFLYYILSTLASILWWGYITIEKLTANFKR